VEQAYSKLQQEIMLQEYRLWDYKRNGICGSVIDEIEAHLTYLKSLYRRARSGVGES
jgi:hypothetical protein